MNATYRERTKDVVLRLHAEAPRGKFTWAILNLRDK